MEFLQFGLLFAAGGGGVGRRVGKPSGTRPSGAGFVGGGDFGNRGGGRGGAVRAFESGVDVCGGGGVRGDDDGTRAGYGARARAQGFARLLGRLGGKGYGRERQRVFGWKRLISSGAQGAF